MPWISEMNLLSKKILGYHIYKFSWMALLLLTTSNIDFIRHAVCPFAR